MSTTVPEISRKAEERILSGLRTSHDTILEATDALAKPLERIVPNGPKLTLPKELPTTSEAVDGAFGFTIRVIEAQRSFASGLLGSVSPVVRKLTGQTTAKTTKA